MQMSRMSLLMIAAGSPAAAAPAGATAEEALERYRQVFVPTPVLDCPPSADPDEVVVCAKAGPAPYRLPLPVAASAPRPSDRAGGEQLSAMGSGPGTCTPVGRDQRCNGGLPVIPIAIAVAKAAVQVVGEIIDPDR